MAALGRYLTRRLWADAAAAINEGTVVDRFAADGAMRTRGMAYRGPFEEVSMTIAKTLFDFTQPASVDGWFAIDDRVMGGVSRSRLRHDAAGHAVFEGEVSRERGGGFASVRCAPGLLGLPDATACVVEARGDGGTYKLGLLTDDRLDGTAYQCAFTPEPAAGWQTIVLPLQAFRLTFRGREQPSAAPLDPSRIRQVGLLIGGGQAGRFALALRSIRLTRGGRADDVVGGASRDHADAGMPGIASLGPRRDALRMGRPDAKLHALPERTADHACSTPTLLRQHGLGALAALVEALPMRPPVSSVGTFSGRPNAAAGDALAQSQWRLQLETNLPMLVLASVRLLRLAERLGLRRLLFCARDGLHWLRIFETLNQCCRWGLEARYFLTSRVCRLMPSPSYLAYAQASIDEGSMVVDLCGTGWTLSHLYRRLGRVAPTFLLHDLGPGRRGGDPYRAFLPPVERVAASSLVDSVRLNNSLLEVANYNETGMTLDVVGPDRPADEPVPLVEDPCYPPEVLAAIEGIASARDAFTATMLQHDLEPVVLEAVHRDDQLSMVALALYRRLCADSSSMRAVMGYHVRQDRRTALRLRFGLESADEGPRGRVQRLHRG